MMGFLSLLKPISEISLGLGLSIRGSPDSVASASKFQLNWPRESVATYFSLDNSLLFDKTSGDSESQNYYYNRTGYVMHGVIYVECARGASTSS
jgi:hypothetical protein